MWLIFFVIVYQWFNFFVWMILDYLYRIEEEYIVADLNSFFSTTIYSRVFFSYFFAFYRLSIPVISFGLVYSFSEKISIAGRNQIKTKRQRKRKREREKTIDLKLYSIIIQQRGVTIRRAYLCLFWLNIRIVRQVKKFSSF